MFSNTNDDDDNYNDDYNDEEKNPFFQSLSEYI